MAKPSVLTDWANSVSADVVTPPAGKVARGWIVGERPPAGFLNFLFKEIVGWLGYVRDFETFAHTFSALATFNGAAGDDVAAIASAPSTITARKLLWEMGGGSEGRKVRFYRTSAGLLEVTFNARWRAATTDWSADTSVIGARADSAKLVVSSTGLAIYRPATSVGTSTWADSSFERLTWGPDDGRWSVVSPTTSAGGSNPAASEAVANQLRAKNIPKAWGRVSMVTGTPTIVDGFNLAWDSNPDANTIRLKFPTGGAMADANYLVLIHAENAQVNCMANPAARTAGYFDVTGYEFVTPFNQIALNSLGTFKFDVLVFGKQS